MRDLILINGIVCKFDWFKKGGPLPDMKKWNAIKQSFFFTYYVFDERLFMIEVKPQRNSIAYLVFDNQLVADFVYDQKIIFINTLELGLVHYFYYIGNNFKIGLEKDNVVSIYSSKYFKVLQFEDSSILLKYKNDSMHYSSMAEAVLLNEDLRKINYDAT